jgi:organic radical activating enzyme
MYQVNEVFNTIQGEGMLAGTPATFIRLQGCTVGCPWCDTQYTWKAGGTKWETQALVESLDLLPLVVITGGEPTLYDLDDLLIKLRAAGQRRWGYKFKIQMETSGQNELKGSVTPDWVTWSPKHNLHFQIPTPLHRYIAEIKWVVDDDLDFVVVESTFNMIRARQPLHEVHNVLMPEGCPPSKEHIDRALQALKEHPTWHFSDRIQWRIGVK